VTAVITEAEAMALPPGVVVGDTYGGRSFTDNVAEILESRSYGGWREVYSGKQRWTLIRIAR